VKTALEKKSSCYVNDLATPLRDQILVLDRRGNFLTHGAPRPQLVDQFGISAMLASAAKLPRFAC
jgi:hypothetical protein